MAKVDIIMATYNGEKYLAEQIESILSQTYMDFRLLISDDKSSDNTRSIIENYAQKDSRIYYFYQEKNMGVIKNFEFLLQKVESPWFMFCDQDDIWKKEKIEKSIEKIKETNAELVYTDLEIVDSDLHIIEPSYWRFKGLYHKIKQYNHFESLYLNNFITGCTMLCKKEIITKALPLPHSSKYVLHDYWIALIASQEGKIAYLEEPLIQYRQHKNNHIGSKRKSDKISNFDEMRNLFIEVKKQHFSVFIQQEEKFKEEKIRILNRQSLQYFEHLEKKQYLNVKNWKLFFKLYQYETWNYKMENFIILNIPIVARILFNIKKKVSLLSF